MCAIFLINKIMQIANMCAFFPINKITANCNHRPSVLNPILNIIKHKAQIYNFAKDSTYSHVVRSEPLEDLTINAPVFL